MAPLVLPDINFCALNIPVILRNACLLITWERPTGTAGIFRFSFFSFVPQKTEYSHMFARIIRKFPAQRLARFVHEEAAAAEAAPKMFGV